MSMEGSTSTNSFCVVCGRQAEGTHFGVECCRACSSFFRRAIVKRCKYKCRRANNGCKVKNASGPLCKACRLQQCLRCGMKENNIQLNWDKWKHTARGQKANLEPDQAKAHNYKIEKQPNSNLLEEKEKEQKRLEELCLFLPSLDNVKTLVSETFKHFNPSTTFQADEKPANSLELMQFALQRIRNDTLNLEFLNVLNCATVEPALTRSLVKLSEWLMFCPEFAMCSTTEKGIIFRNTAFAWQRLERIHFSLKVFGARAIDEKVYLVSNTLAVNVNNVLVDLSPMSDFTPEYWKSILLPVMDGLFTEIGPMMFDLNIDDVEITYMLCQLAFHTEGLQLSDGTQNLFILFRNQLSNDLHFYYTKKQNRLNYADRLRKMLNLVHMVEKIQTKKRSVVELAQIFNVIKPKKTVNCRC